MAAPAQPGKPVKVKQMISTFRKISALLTPAERKKLGLLQLLDIIVSIIDLVFLALLLFIIQLYTGAIPPGKLSFLPAGLVSRDSLAPVVVFFLLFGGKNLAGFLVYRAQSRYLFRIASRMSRNRLIEFQEGTWSSYVNTDSSVQIREISYQPLEFCQHVLGGMQQIITQSVLILLAVAAIISFRAKLFFLVLIILLPPAFLVFYLIKRRLRSVGTNARISSERSLQHLQEALAGYVESNIYHKNKVFLERYMIHQEQFNKYLSDQTVVQGIPSRMIEIFALLGVVILIMVNHWSGGGDHTAVITIGVFMAAAYKIIPGIVKILGTSGQMNAYAFTLENLEPAAAVNRETPPVRGRIRSVTAEHVRFSYGDRKVLDNQGLCMTAGDFVGLSGASGKGKTTLLNLLLGFLEPDAGAISINDAITDRTQRRQYWQRIAYVKQQPFLLHDTILQNITLNGTSFSEERLREVIDLSGLTAVIDAYPEKWHKVIAENGRDISGGQKQRIAIARALYKDADLIILDEPFNELDEGSETSLLRYFEYLSQQGKMILLITHNKKSLDFCNKIISLDEAE